MPRAFQYTATVNRRCRLKLKIKLVGVYSATNENQYYMRTRSDVSEVSEVSQAQASCREEILYLCFLALV